MFNPGPMLNISFRQWGKVFIILSRGPFVLYTTLQYSHEINWSATTRKPLTVNVNNVDHLDCSAMFCWETVDSDIHIDANRLKLPAHTHHYAATLHSHCTPSKTMCVTMPKKLCVSGFNVVADQWTLQSVMCTITYTFVLSVIIYQTNKQSYFLVETKTELIL